MPQAVVQQAIMNTLTGLQQEVHHIKTDVHKIMEFFEDTRLTQEELQLVDGCLAKIKAGNKAAFISHERLKKELGL